MQAKRSNFVIFLVLGIILNTVFFCALSVCPVVSFLECHFEFFLLTFSASSRLGTAAISTCRDRCC